MSEPRCTCSQSIGRDGIHIHKFPLHGEPTKEVEEAERTIERLRAELDTAVLREAVTEDQRNRLAVANPALRRDRDRLREALEWYADPDNFYIVCQSPTAMVERARRALDPDSHS